jgi:hypothetical protein
LAFLAHLPDAAQRRKLPAPHLEYLDVAPTGLKPQGRNLDRAAENDLAGFLKRHGVIVARAHVASRLFDESEYEAR